MPFEIGAKKAGLSLVRAFLHSIEGVSPYSFNRIRALPATVQKRNSINYKFKTYKDGKILGVRCISDSI